MVGLVVEYKVVGFELLIIISQCFVHGISILGLLFIFQVGRNFPLSAADHMVLHSWFPLSSSCYSLCLLPQKFSG